MGVATEVGKVTSATLPGCDGEEVEGGGVEL